LLPAGGGDVDRGAGDSDQVVKDDQRGQRRFPAAAGHRDEDLGLRPSDRAHDPLLKRL
jgi:hypothetical protein